MQPMSSIKINGVLRDDRLNFAMNGNEIGGGIKHIKCYENSLLLRIIKFINKFFQFASDVTIGDKTYFVNNKSYQEYLKNSFGAELNIKVLDLSSNSSHLEILENCISYYDLYVEKDSAANEEKTYHYPLNKVESIQHRNDKGEMKGPSIRHLGNTAEFGPEEAPEFSIEKTQDALELKTQKGFHPFLKIVKEPINPISALFHDKKSNTSLEEVKELTELGFFNETFKEVGINSAIQNGVGLDVLEFMKKNGVEIKPEHLDAAIQAKNIGALDWLLNNGLNFDLYKLRWSEFKFLGFDDDVQSFFIERIMNKELNGEERSLENVELMLKLAIKRGDADKVSEELEFLKLKLPSEDKTTRYVNGKPVKEDIKRIERQCPLRYAQSCEASQEILDILEPSGKLFDIKYNGNGYLSDLLYKK